jgi:hypothetical protein
VRLIRGGVDFVVTVENLQEKARGLSLLREVRDWDGQPVVVRISVNNDRWTGLRVELWGVRDCGRSDFQASKEWEKQLHGWLDTYKALPGVGHGQTVPIAGNGKGRSSRKG